MTLEEISAEFSKLWALGRDSKAEIDHLIRAAYEAGKRDGYFGATETKGRLIP